MGGGPKHLYDLSSNLKNIDVYIAAPKEEPFYSKYKEIGKDVIEIPHRKFNIFKFIILLTYCKENGINVVHSHGRGAGIYSRLLGLFGMRVIHTFHGVHIESGIIGNIKKNIDYILKFSTSKFICVSADELKQALGYGLCVKYNTEVIYNGVLLTEINKVKSDEIREKIGVDKETILVGTLARFTYQKGLDLFIENVMHKDLNNLHFVIAGNGEDFKMIEMLIEKNNLKRHITLIGKTDTPESFLKDLDIYFSFSRWEGFPLAVLEAMNMGKMCILSDNVGHRNIGSYENGVLFHNNKNFKDLIEANIKNIKNYGESAKKHVNTEFSLEKMILSTEKIYEELNENLQK